MMYGNEQTRSFCYIDDAVEANNISCMESEKTNGEIYHIGSSEEISIEQLIKKLEKCYCSRRI